MFICFSILASRIPVNLSPIFDLDLDFIKVCIEFLKTWAIGSFNVTGKLFGIAPKKIENLANLTKKELQSAQMFINKNADLLIAMLPEGSTVSGTSTGVPNTLLKAFYTKTERAKAAVTGSKSGLPIQVKNMSSSKLRLKRKFLTS